jgi:hypothetical protein
MLPIVLALISIAFALVFGLFGNAIWGEVEPPLAGSSSLGRVLPAPTGGRRPPARSSASVRIAMQVAISLIILAAAFYIILFGGYDGDQQKWAYGSIGTVVGFWLKG